MIEKLLDQSALKSGHEVSFILNNKILSKSGREWQEVKGDLLSHDDWEDLKDLCLQGNEKVQLETKGYVVGVYESGANHKWKFSFIEKKDCFRAHLSLIKSKDEVQSQIENPLFWETMKKEKGLFIIAGERRQGKTSLLQEVVFNEQKSKLSLVGVHATVQTQDWLAIDSVVHLGTETLEFDSNHPLYEGVQRVIVDLNSVKNWKKWIEIAEQGQSVLVSISTNSVKTIIAQLVSDLDASTLQRLFNILNGVLVQKLVGPGYFPCSEILVLKEKQKEIILNHVITNTLFKMNLALEFKETYQSLNQSIIQKLIRRKVDVAAAFESSDDPEALDVMLKKMGL